MKHETISVEEEEEKSFVFLERYTLQDNGESPLSYP